MPCQAFWKNFDIFHFLPSLFPTYFIVGVNKSENQFLSIFSPFQKIFNNFDFFSFLTKLFLHHPFLWEGGGGGKKNPKINFDQFSRHFRQFGRTLIFSVDKQNSDPLFYVFFWGGGATPKFIFVIFHLVSLIWVCS